MLKTKNPREAAYLALLASLQGECFIADSLEEWRVETNPPVKDFHFAQQIAFGASQMALALDHLAKQLSAKNKLDLKLKEKALVRLALYQHCFLDKIPLYANNSEMTALAKRYCHSTFAKFLNALLRKLEKVTPSLPTDDTANALSIRFSYPRFFVEELIADYGLEQAKLIMEIGNKPRVSMARIRKPDLTADIQCDDLKMSVIKDGIQLQAIASSPDYYIQNITPAALIYKLKKTLSQPRIILDLCASPGGKLILAHDLFPSSQLYANDVSEEKLIRIRENRDKYAVHAHLSSGPGEAYAAQTQFDLIILDVPCSNTGVLNKRAEARWRLSLQALNELEQTQQALLAHAVSLLAPGGVIWYLTCSILKKENEVFIQKMASQLNLKVLQQQTFLPNLEGWDGGYGCALQKQD